MIPILLKDKTFLYIKWDDKDKLISDFEKIMIFLDFYEIHPINENQLCPSLTQGIARDFILEICPQMKWNIIPYAEHANLSEIDVKRNQFKESLDFIQNSTILTFNAEDLK